MKRFVCLVVLATVAAGSVFGQKGYEKSLALNGDLGIGDERQTAVTVSMINGYRFSPYFYAGAGLGIGFSNHTGGRIDVPYQKMLNTDKNMDVVVPLYANLKANFTKGKISPFVALDAGYTFDFIEWYDFGLFATPAVGVDFRTGKNVWSLKAGFNVQSVSYHCQDGNYSDMRSKNYNSTLKSLNVGLGFTF